MDADLRRMYRTAMRGVPERVGLQFAHGDIEMRARPNGTAAGSNFEWNGYATVYGAEFDMWDQNGEPFTEHVAPGAARRSLANPNLDVPFLVGHNDAGIPLARTKSGTMRLSEDSHGVFTHVPAMDGRREEVRALASAVERGDLDEMSLAFVCLRQAWDDSYERRTVLEMDLHRGDVCAVTHGANPATAGASMLPVEQLSFRRPAVIGGGPGLLEVLSVPKAERDKAKAAGNSLPDGSYPINNVHQLHAAAILAASHHGDWKAAQALIRRRAKELGVDVTTLPGFGEAKSDGRPLELRASAAENMNTAASSDYDAAAAPHDEFTVTSDAVAHGHPGRPCVDPDGDGDCDATPEGDTDHDYWTADGKQIKPLPGQAATSATVAVDDSTGIPGDEVQLAAQRKLDLMLRELELEELAAAR